jgi:hypothetical protein
MRCRRICVRALAGLPQPPMDEVVASVWSEATDDDSGEDESVAA